MNEASLTTEFSHWMKARWKEGSTAIEFKIVKAPSKSLSFSSFRPQQIPSLLMAKHSGLWHKLSDASPDQKPFDSFFLSGTSAYVGIFWVIPRKLKRCTLIDVDEFVKFMEECGKKSITLAESEKISTHCIEL